MILGITGKGKSDLRKKFRVCTHFLSLFLRPLLKQIKNSAESRVVLDCSTEKIYEVLKQAQQIGMMSDYHSYLITSLDLHTVNLEPFQYGGTNITAFRLVDPDNNLVRQTVRNWTASDSKVGKKFSTNHDNTSVIKAETALVIIL